MTKRQKEIVINKCFGGFGLSHEAVMLYAKLKGIPLYPFWDLRDGKGNLKFEGEKFTTDIKKRKYDFESPYYSTKPLVSGNYEEGSYFSQYKIPRDDPALIKTVKRLGAKSWGEHAVLKIVKIPLNVDWIIDEYDGSESVEEKHRSWS